MRRHHPGLSWPRPAGPDPVACPSCDALQQAPALREGDAARCGCCGEIMFQNRPRSLARATAFSASALILMVLVHSFPFLTMEATGTRTQLTLFESARSLLDDGNPVLAGAIVLFTVIAPLLIAASLLYITAPLRNGIALPGAVTLARWTDRLLPWSMLEVFLLGLIVSLLKLGDLADLHFGIGLWALAGLVLCLAAALAGIDSRELWDRIEVAGITRKRSAQALPSRESESEPDASP